MSDDVFRMFSDGRLEIEVTGMLRDVVRIPLLSSPAWEKADFHSTAWYVTPRK